MPFNFFLVSVSLVFKNVAFLGSVRIVYRMKLNNNYRQIKDEVAQIIVDELTHK